MGRPRTVVIGYGNAGRSFHSYLIRLTPGLELAGVCSRSPATRERIVADQGCRAYESFDQVLADPDVDLVVLATPSNLHAEQATAALKHGKHVVTDKPMCRSLAECDAMIATAERVGKILSVFHNRRWDGDYRTVRELMASGRLGDVRRIEMAWAAARMPGGWRGTAEALGGRIYDLGSHMIDQLCQLFPQRVTSVYAKLQYDSPEHDVESDAVMVVGFEDGATGVVSTGAVTFAPKPRFYVTGPGGTYVKYGVDPQEAAMKAGDIDAAREPEELFGVLNTTGKAADDQIIPTLAGRWRCYYEDLAACLAGAAPNPVPLPSVRRTMAVLTAVFESHRTEQVVRVTELSGAP